MDRIDEIIKKSLDGLMLQVEENMDGQDLLLREENLCDEEVILEYHNMVLYRLAVKCLASTKIIEHDCDECDGTMNKQDGINIAQIVNNYRQKGDEAFELYH